jgi:hypothetical protein
MKRALMRSERNRLVHDRDAYSRKADRLEPLLNLRHVRVCQGTRNEQRAARFGAIGEGQISGDCDDHLKLIEGEALGDLRREGRARPMSMTEAA